MWALIDRISSKEHAQIWKSMSVHCLAADAKLRAKVRKVQHVLTYHGDISYLEQRV